MGQDSPYNDVDINEEHDFDVYFKNVLQEYESHPSIAHIRDSNRVVENHNGGFSFNNMELGEVERKRYQENYGHSKYANRQVVTTYHRS